VTNSFKYDVAISFLQEDELLAVNIGDRLADRVGVDVFVYSKRQDELVGRDGLEAFSGIFGKQSRVVVVLNRQGWGRTPWTRVEETAIKNRGLDDGWDFLLLVRLDRTASIPIWLPKTRIWLGFDRYGIDGAANAIETLVGQSGGIVRAESSVDYAGRVTRHINFTQERRAWWHSQRGLDEAKVAAKAATQELYRLATEIQAKHPELSVSVEQTPESCLARCGSLNLAIGWQPGHFINSSEGAYLFAKLSLRRRGPHFPGQASQEIEVIRYGPDIDAIRKVGWRELDSEWRKLEDDGKFFTSLQLADMWLKRLLELRARQEDGVTL
jgi:hypothetical protein